MNRRDLLKWLSRAIASACAAVLAVPGVNYLWGTTRREQSGERTTQRLVRLSDLLPDQPVDVAVTGTRHDAWFAWPDEVLGRVWLVRRTDESTPAPNSRVDAFCSRCPHLGCEVQLQDAAHRFVCPCHKAAFDLQGRRLGDRQLGHKNPSPHGLRTLPCHVVQDADSGDWWVEVSYENSRSGPSQTA